MVDLQFDDKNYFIFYAAADYNGKLYISDPDNRGLLVYDLDTKEINVKNIFMAENMRDNYWSAFSYNGEIWFVPIRDNQKIAIYNIDNNSIEYLKIPRSEHVCEYQPFSNSYVVGNKVYLTPAYYDSILCVDLMTREIEKIDIGIYTYSGDVHATYKWSCMEKNKIYFCPFNNSLVKSYDVVNGVVEDIPVSVSSGMYTNIIVKDDYIYLMPRKLDNGILKYNLNDKSQETVYINAQYDNTTQYECYFMFDDVIYGLPLDGNIMYLFDCTSGNVDTIEINNNIESIYSYYFAQKINERRYLIISNNVKNPCLIWEKDEIELIDIKLPKDYFMKVLLMEIEKRR